MRGLHIPCTTIFTRLGKPSRPFMEPSCMQPLRGRLRCIIRCAFSKCSTRPACCICNIHQGLYHMMLHNTGDCPRTGLAKIVTWNSGQLFLQVMSFVEWRAALWTGLHGTHRSKPSLQQGHSSSFQEDVFVFTWLRLRKAVDRLLMTASESGGQLDHIVELQRLQGIGNQVRYPSCALHASRVLCMSRQSSAGLHGKAPALCQRS